MRCYFEVISTEIKWNVLYNIYIYILYIQSIILELFSLFVVVVFVVVTPSGRFIRRSKILDWDRRFVVAILLLDLIVVCVKKRKKKRKRVNQQIR